MHDSRGVIPSCVSPGTKPSALAQSHANCGKVQDSYTLRCLPQVHGIAHDTIDFVYGLLCTEMNR